MGSSEDMIAAQWRSIRIASFILFFILVFCGCSNRQQPETLPFYNTADFDAEWIKKEDPAYRHIHRIDTFSLRSQAGRLITGDSLKRHIYVANFFFTTCAGICPKMVNNLALLQDSFFNNEKIKLVSFTVMPWVDTVGKLREYGAQHHIDCRKWYLLTGDKERIYTLARQSFFAEKGLGLLKNNSEFLHTESMLLIDEEGRIRGIYNATQKADVERIASDIRVLLRK